MKILKRGKLQKLAWIGKKVECPECGCKFVLEEKDKSKVSSSTRTIYGQRPGDYSVDCWKTKCPTIGCNALVKINK